MNTSQRNFKRAPFFEEVLVLDSDHLYQASAMNISQNGILISNLDINFDGQELFFMFPLVSYPEFLFMDREKIFLLCKNDFETTVFRCSGQLKRKKRLDDKTSINFLEVAAEIDVTKEKLTKAIQQYVEIFEKNIEFILMLFQDEQLESKELIRSLLHLLGYDNTGKMSTLRSLMLHDYNSLLKL